MAVLVSEAPSTLAELVSPLADAEFLQLLHSRELAFRQGSKGDRFAPLVGWGALRKMIEVGNHPKKPDDIRVTKESAVVPPDQWSTGGKIDTAKLDEFLAKGYSVVVVRIEPHVPALAAICDEIKTRTKDGSFVGVVVTSSASVGAFKTHYDPEDLIIVQVEGTKRWQIFGPVVSNPVRGMPKQTLQDAKLIFDEVLEPGDLLFVPGGNWHHCESGLSTSVHLGFFIIPPTGWHAVNSAMRSLMSEDLFRTPLTRPDGTPSLETLESEVKNRLIERIGELNLADFVQGWSKVAF